MSPAALAGVRACVFDAYGTLLDLNGALGDRAAGIGDRADELSLLWRRKQLEYTWLRSLMRQHADFERVTADALDHALEALSQPAELREPLLAAYRELRPYPEVVAALERLRERGLRLAVLSNGSASMLEDGLRAASLRGHLDLVLSVDEVGVNKPAPEVYALATERLGVEPAETAFFSSNAWDAHGAAVHGFKVVWLNRAGTAPERLPGRFAAVRRTLADIEDLL